MGVGKLRSPAISLGSQSVKATIKHHSLGGLNNTDHFFLFLGSRGLKTKTKVPAGLTPARAMADG